MANPNTFQKELDKNSEEKVRKGVSPIFKPFVDGRVPAA
jgi:hypothetical protein